MARYPWFRNSLYPCLKAIVPSTENLGLVAAMGMVALD